MYNPITFSSSLPDNKKQIFNLGNPQYNSSAANKQYVDSEIAKSNVDTSQFIKKDGTVAMTSDLNLGSNKITNLKIPTGDTDAAYKSYIAEAIAKSQVSASSKKKFIRIFGQSR